MSFIEILEYMADPFCDDDQGDLREYAPELNGEPREIVLD